MSVVSVMAAYSDQHSRTIPVILVRH